MATNLLKQVGVNSDAPPGAITFAPFCLDLGGGRLLHGDRAIPLRPKTWAVLLYLAERPGVLVTKDELLDRIWPDVAVTPDTLNKSIGELRAALEDNSHAPRFIETVNRRGFRFIGKVSGVGCRVPAPRTPLKPAPWHLTLDTRHPTPEAFVGREQELQRLATWFAKAQAGERQIVFVTGPAGIGKTALVDKFLSSLQTRANVLIGRGQSFEQHGLRETYLPVLEALERLARRPDIEPLLELLHRTAPTWLLQMPWLLGEADREALRRSLQAVGAERMPRELAALLERLTTQLTLVLVLEDLHWSDPSTIDLLALLAQRRDAARLLVIGTYRPADVVVHEHVLASAVQTLRLRGQCREVPLHDLTEEAVHAYLALRFPGNQFSPVLARRIHEHTGGQPLFLVAEINHMLSRGWILDTAPGWGLSAPPETIDLGVPDDVRSMIETQLYRLSPAERSLLEAASVAESGAAAPVIAAALDCEVGDAELRCETLARAQQFLRVAGTVEWPDGTVERHYAFTHELYRQVVYEETPEGRRTRLHRRIGEYLEAAHGAKAVEIAPQLAAHFQRGRDPARALRHLTAAGLRARQRFASREAIGCLERALALVALLPDPDQRRRQEIEVRLALGRALGDACGFGAEPVRENYERVSELFAAAQGVAPGSAAQLFEAVYARWYLHALRAERDETLALAAELEGLAGRLGTPGQGVLADSALVRTAFYDGRFTDARRHMESLRARQPEGQDAAEPVGYGVDPVTAATIHYAGALWFLGDPEAARTTARAGLTRARESGNPFFLSAALGQTALVELLCGNSLEGGDLAAQAVSLAAEHGYALWHAIALAVKGWARVQQGQAPDGSREIERALEALQATGTQFFLAYVYAFLAEGRLRAGALADGLAAANAGLALTATTLDRGYEPELWRLKGELLLRVDSREPVLSNVEGPVLSNVEGSRVERSRPARARARRPSTRNWEEAERCLVRALEISRSAEAKSLELRAATSLTRAWEARGGRSGEARAVLEEICGWFDSGLATPDLVEARALLAELATAR